MSEEEKKEFEELKKEFQSLKTYINFNLNDGLHLMELRVQRLERILGK